jgi:hypothetical protein
MNSDYYQKAVDIGKKLDQYGADVELTGHSLGGGLASAASEASGLPADTFNAAGLNSGTVAKYGGTVQSSAINAYRVNGEILGDVQTQNVGGTVVAGLGGLLLGGIPGAITGILGKIGLAALMPDPVGTPIALEGSGLDPVARHGIDQVIAGLESQKTADQAVLAQATGIGG